MSRVTLLLAMSGLLLGCSDNGERRTIVASIYPLAYAADRMVGPGWEVIDLTPPGTEAHDLELSLEDRADIHEADVVLYLGDIGFQPQVEEAVADASGIVEAVGFIAHFGDPPVADPHFWVAPAGMRDAAFDIAEALSAAETEDYDVDPLWREATGMHHRYNVGLKVCRYRTVLASHEAFHTYTLYKLRQFGLTGSTPEAEPSAERLSEAHALVDAGEAGAIFYEDHDDARRIAESFANDADVPALPLSTLESRPAEGDYFTVMQDNLESLREGLQCR